MTISFEDYNKVITGLRTQLQLHNAFQEQQYAKIKDLESQLKLKHDRVNELCREVNFRDEIISSLKSKKK